MNWAQATVPSKAKRSNPPPSIFSSLVRLNVHRGVSTGETADEEEEKNNNNKGNTHDGVSRSLRCCIRAQFCGAELRGEGRRRPEILHWLSMSPIYPMAFINRSMDERKKVEQDSEERMKHVPPLMHVPKDLDRDMCIYIS